MSVPEGQHVWREIGMAGQGVFQCTGCGRRWVKNVDAWPDTSTCEPIVTDEPITAPEMISTDQIREWASDATPGPWGVRFFEDDHLGEVARFARALAMSAEHSSDTGRVAYRLIAGGPEACTEDGSDSDWLNLGFMGNGPQSKANAVFIANASPTNVLAMCDLIDQLYDRLATRDREWIEALRGPLQGDEHIEAVIAQLTGGEP